MSDPPLRALGSRTLGGGHSRPRIWSIFNQIWALPETSKVPKIGAPAALSHVKSAKNQARLRRKTTPVTSTFLLHSYIGGSKIGNAYSAFLAQLPLDNSQIHDFFARLRRALARNCLLNSQKILFFGPATHFSPNILSKTVIGPPKWWARVTPPIGLRH